MSHQLRIFLLAATGLGDSGVLALIVFIAAIYLFFCRCRRGALALILAFILAAGGIGLAKLILLGCRAGHEDFGIHSPSGHTAVSFAVYATLATLLSSRLSGWKRTLVRLVAALLIFLIAFSRWMLGYHTAGEVITGLAVGALVAMAARIFLFYKNRSVPPFDVFPLLLAILMVAFILHGTQLPAEEMIRRIAAKLSEYLPLCRSLDDLP